MYKQTTIMISVLILGLVGLLVFTIVVDKESDESHRTRMVECESKHGTYFWREGFCLDVPSIPLESK